VARLKKTSVYLTQKELAGLRRSARLTGRTQSDLIREGVRRVAFSVASVPRRERAAPGAWPLTRGDGFLIHLRQKGLTVTQMAREMSVSEAEVLAGIARIDAFEKSLVRYVVSFIST
jgi:hypothetical protein